MMNNLEPKTLTAAQHRDIAKYRKVFNLDELEYYMYVKLDPPLSNEYFLNSVEEKLEDGTLREIAHFRDVVQRESPTWLKIKTDFMDKRIGLHVYKLTFADTVTNVVSSLWFSYRIQSDNPDKPYVYMERENVCSCCGEVEKKC